MHRLLVLGALWCVTDKVISRLPCSKLFCLIIVTAGGRVCLHVLLLGVLYFIYSRRSALTGSSGKDVSKQVAGMPCNSFSTCISGDQPLNHSTIMVGKQST
jgi:hypothetical protein